MSRPNTSRSNYPASSASSMRSVGTQGSNGRYFRPVPYATTVALEQFFDGGSMKEHLARRTTAAAPTQSSRSKSHHNGSSTRHGHSKRTQTANPTHLAAPAHTPGERDVGKGASLAIVDEQGAVWFDWEEKQEFTPLMTVEDERSGWVGFPGAGNRDSISSSSSEGEITGAGYPLRTVLDAFTLPAAMHTATGLFPEVSSNQQPRPRGAERRRVRADSLPTSPTTLKPTLWQEQEAARREFLSSSFDPSKLSQPSSDLASLTKASKRGSISIKGLKKLFSKKSFST